MRKCKAKVVAFALFCWVSALPGLASAWPGNPQRPDQWGLSKTIASGSTLTVVIDADGDILPGNSGAQTLGESTHTWKIIYVNQVVVSSGLINTHEVFPELPVSSSDSFKPLGYYVSSATLINGASTFYEANISTQPTVPRNLIVYSTYTGPGASTTTLVGTVTFYGLNNFGQTISEAIGFSTRMPNTVDFSTGGYGAVAFAHISSFTIEITSMTDTFGLGTSSISIVVATGNKIGLCNRIDASSDVWKIQEEFNDREYGDVTIDPVRGTIYFVLPPDNDRTYHVWYRSKRSLP